MMRIQLLLAGAVIMTVMGCVRERSVDPAFLGSAVIESRTYTVSSVTQGPLVAVYKSEGESVAADETIAIVVNGINDHLYADPDRGDGPRHRRMALDLAHDLGGELRLSRRTDLAHERQVVTVGRHCAGHGRQQRHHAVRRCLHAEILQRRAHRDRAGRKTVLLELGDHDSVLLPPPRTC